MSKLVFHKCRICGKIFYHSGKQIYCTECIPTYKSNDTASLNRAVNHALDNLEALERRRAFDRARWHRRMANPAFRERERLRSLVRARAERKYAKTKPNAKN